MKKLLLVALSLLFLLAAVCPDDADAGLFGRRKCRRRCKKSPPRTCQVKIDDPWCPIYLLATHSGTAGIYYTYQMQDCKHSNLNSTLDSANNYTVPAPCPTGTMAPNPPCMLGAPSNGSNDRPIESMLANAGMNNFVTTTVLKPNVSVRADGDFYIQFTPMGGTTRYAHVLLLNFNDGTINFDFRCVHQVSAPDMTKILETDTSVDSSTGFCWQVSVSSLTTAHDDTFTVIMKKMP